MERSKLIKIVVAAVIGVAAVVLIATNLLGGRGGPKEGAGAKDPTPAPAERSGGGRTMPGEKGD